MIARIMLLGITATTLKSAWPTCSARHVDETISSFRSCITLGWDQRGKTRSCAASQTVPRGAGEAEGDVRLCRPCGRPPQ